MQEFWTYPAGFIMNTQVFLEVEWCLLKFLWDLMVGPGLQLMKVSLTYFMVELCDSMFHEVHLLFIIYTLMLCLLIKHASITAGLE